MAEHLVISRLLYAASAWWGSASKRRCIDTFIRHGIRTEFCDENMPAMSDLVEDADDVPFQQAMRDKHQLFPNRKTELKYDLRQRRHEFTFTQKSKIRYLADCNFITRLLYEDCY